MISDFEIKKIVIESFSEAFNEFDRLDKKTNTINKKRSSKFITEIGERLLKHYESLTFKYHLNCQRFIDKYSKKMSGEWLFDISITVQESIYDLEKTDAEIKINTQLIWAIESESDTGLDSFARDFGKLLCANSENYLYLNGLNQNNKANQNNYILRRLNTVSKLLEKNILFNNKEFYYGFWVSPEKKDGRSIWECYELTELLDMIKVFKYTNDTNKFIGTGMYFYEIL